MRRFLFVLLFILLLGLPNAPAVAAPDDGRKPLVALLPVVNNAQQKYTRYMVEMVDEMLQAKFSTDRYTVIKGQVLVDALKRQGIGDYNAADIMTVRAALRNIQVDYIVRAEILPVNTQQRLYFPDLFLLMKSWSATVPVNLSVINGLTGGTVYDATISEWAKNDGIVGITDRHNAIRIALNNVLTRFAQETIILD